VRERGLVDPVAGRAAAARGVDRGQHRAAGPGDPGQLAEPVDRRRQVVEDERGEPVVDGVVAQREGGQLTGDGGRADVAVPREHVHRSVDRHHARPGPHELAARQAGARARVEHEAPGERVRRGGDQVGRDRPVDARGVGVPRRRDARVGIVHRHYDHRP
jgi:hypothetical protein